MTEDARSSTGLPAHDLRRHLLDALLPNAAFLIGYKAFDVHTGVAAALGVGAVLVAARLLARRPLTVVLGAFAMVALHAAPVLITGRAQDFFLPWIVLSGALLPVFLVSIARNRPVTRTLARLDGFTAERPGHRRATALWSGLWAVNLLVGIPLYLHDQVVAMGVAHFLLGAPAFALLGWATWRSLHEKTPTPDPFTTERSTL